MKLRSCSLALANVLSLGVAVLGLTGVAIAQEVSPETSPAVPTQDVSPEASPANSESAYPQEIVDAYMDGCLQGAVAEGATQDQATQLCGCSISEFQARFTLEEFTTIVEQTEQTRQLPTEIGEVVQYCVQQVTSLR
jgi:hypothetical protein